MATIGLEALAAAVVQRPDLIIVDMLLAGLSGLSVADTLRQQDPLLSAIAISADCDVLERPEGKPAGLDPRSIAFLAKPFDLVFLMGLVDQMLTQPVLSQVRRTA